MANQQPIAGEWDLYPDAGAAAVGAAAVAPAQPMPWDAYPDAPIATTAPVDVTPVQGYERAHQFSNAMERELTFGLSDKMAAAMTAVSHAAGLQLPTDVSAPGDSFGQSYHKNLDAIRKEGERFSETNPVASKIATGSGVVGSIASLPAKGVAATAGLVPKIVEGAKVGGIVGGLSGFGNSNDTSVTGDLAATGAGAVTGGVIGGGGAAVADRAAQPFIGWLTRKFGPNAAQNQAVQVIAKRMTADAKAGGPTAQDMLDLLNAAPDKPQTLADVAGENVRQYAGSIARQPGEGRQFARNTLNQRDVEAGPRIAQDVNSAIANGGSTYSTSDALMSARSAAARPQYRAAFQQQQVWSPRLQQFLDDPVMRQGLRQGMELERIDSVTNDQPFNPTQLGVDLDQDGNVVFKQTPNMRVLDAGKRGLDAMIAAERDPITGRLSQRGVAIDQFRRAYVNELDGLDKSGTYAAARAAWSGPSASRDALQLGNSIFEQEPDEIAANVERLRQNAPGDLEFYRLGAANAIKTKIARTGMGGDEAKRLIGNQYTQQQLRPLFDREDDYSRFINAATAENRMFETRQKLIGGSQTAERVAEDNALPEGAAGHFVRGGVAALEGAPAAAGLSLAKGVGALTRGESPEVNAAASRILFTPQSMTDPTIFRNLQDLLAAQQRRTGPRLLSIPASAAAAQNPASSLSTLIAAGQYLPLPSFHGEH